MTIYTTKEINGVLYDYAYSDIGMKIERNGARYTEAIDPLNSNRKYTETNEPIEVEPLNELEEKAQAYDILMGVSE